MHPTFATHLGVIKMVCQFFYMPLWLTLLRPLYIYPHRSRLSNKNITIMKKFSLLSTLSLLLLCSASVDGQITKARFTVIIPSAGHAADTTVFVAGSFNNWNPMDSNYMMKPKGHNRYTLTIPCFGNKRYEYKYTLGGWGGVEKSTNGKDIDNRSFTSGKHPHIKDTIACWPQPKPLARKDTSMMLNKEQLGKMMAMKDSFAQILLPMLPKLMESLKNINLNLLSPHPDEDVIKQYNKQTLGDLSLILDKLTGAFIEIAKLLTPQQKQMLLKAMNEPNAAKDIINLITQSLVPGN